MHSVWPLFGHAYRVFHEFDRKILKKFEFCYNSCLNTLYISLFTKVVLDIAAIYVKYLPNYTCNTCVYWNSPDLKTKIICEKFYKELYCDLQLINLPYYMLRVGDVAKQFYKSRSKKFLTHNVWNYVSAIYNWKWIVRRQWTKHDSC